MTEPPRQPDPAATRARGVAFLRPIPGVNDQYSTLHAYLLRRGGWEPDEDCGWRYTGAFFCTPLPLHDCAYEYLVPGVPHVEFQSTSKPHHLDNPYDLLWLRSTGVLPGGCPDHAIVERELSLHDLTEPMLDAALTKIEVQLDVDEILEFIRCRLVGPCSESR